MKVMEIIKKGFSVANKNLGLVGLLFGLSLVLSLLFILTVTVFVGMNQITAPKAPENLPPDMVFKVLAVLLVVILVNIFFQGATLGLVRDYLKSGQLKLGNFISNGSKYYLRLLGLGALLILVFLILGIIIALIVAGIAAIKNVALTVIAAVLLGLALAYLAILLVPAPFALVADESGVIAALKSGIAASKKALGKLFLTLLVFIVLSVIIEILFRLITLAITAQGAQALAVIGQILVGIVYTAIYSYFGVVFAASLTAFYLGLKTKEASS